MDSGRYETDDHLPKPNYLAQLNQRLAGYVHVQSTSSGDSDKTGAASANIRIKDGKVVIEHAARCLTIETTDPSAVISRVKEIWRRDMHGPCLRDRSVQTNN